MKYFLDTEFIEDGQTITLLSLALVAEDGREFYQENYQASVFIEKANLWVQQNVFPHLQMVEQDKYGFLIRRKSLARSKQEIREGILSFIGQDIPEFWGYYCDYDWVIFCQLFGTMMDLPKGWPMYCRDLQQALDALDLSYLKQTDDMPHHALSDARWISETYKKEVVC